MNRFAISLAASLTAASALSLPIAATAAQVQIQATGPVIELSVTENVASDPDIANLSAGVTTQAQTAVEAMRLNARQMSRVIDQIEALGVERDDIQTSGINLNAEYDYDQESRQQVFRGYRVSNQVNVTLRDIDETGAVLDALVAAGATDLGGISWTIDDPAAAREQARAAAIETARERARAYAHRSGYGDVRLLEISETIVQAGPQPMLRTADVQEQSFASTPVRPGQVQSGVTITVKYEMTS
ncbi:SIMPL domain-containing protein [Alteraurantiacibacter aestuarii]|uniref:SIMPL domain-containing protein n=1 Tax=Alteraurantiacibacter aestuarii TaxID=650004 RepID=UPI0031D23E04